MNDSFLMMTWVGSTDTEDEWLSPLHYLRAPAGSICAPSANENERTWEASKQYDCINTGVISPGNCHSLIAYPDRSLMLCNHPWMWMIQRNLAWLSWFACLRFASCSLRHVRTRAANLQHMFGWNVGLRRREGSYWYRMHSTVPRASEPAKEA
jgi:hypothetical protein